MMHSNRVLRSSLLIALLAVGAPSAFAQEAKPKKAYLPVGEVREKAAEANAAEPAKAKLQAAAAQTQAKSKPYLNTGEFYIRVPMGVSSLVGGSDPSTAGAQGALTEPYSGFSMGFERHKVGANKVIFDGDMDWSYSDAKYGGGVAFKASGGVGRLSESDLRKGAMYVKASGDLDTRSSNGIGIESAALVGGEVGVMTIPGGSAEGSGIRPSQRIALTYKVGRGAVNSEDADFPMSDSRGIFELGTFLKSSGLIFRDRRIDLDAGARVRDYRNKASVTDLSGRLSFGMFRNQAAIYAEARSKRLTTADPTLRSGHLRVFNLGFSAGGAFQSLNPSSSNSAR